MQIHRLRYWPSIKPTLSQCLLLTGTLLNILLHYYLLSIFNTLWIYISFFCVLSHFQLFAVAVIGVAVWVILYHTADWVMWDNRALICGCLLVILGSCGVLFISILGGLAGYLPNKTFTVAVSVIRLYVHHVQNTDKSGSVFCPAKANNSNGLLLK